MTLVTFATLMVDTPKSGGVLEALPDPMRPALGEIGFVMLLVVVLFFYLKGMLFRPLVGLMDARDHDMAAGSDSKAEANAMFERRQAEYKEQMKALRAQAFERKKALAAAATEEKERVLGEARNRTQAQRQTATRELVEQYSTAEMQLRTEVESLAESMAQHLLKQA